jgi:prepilin peptidase CpaA
MDPSKIQVVYAATAVVCSCVACIFDLRQHRIPNWLTGPALIAGMAVHLFFSEWRGLADAASAALLAGLVFLMFYLAGGMGAGDVKLMAASASIVGLSALGTLLIFTGLAGGLLAVGVSVARGVLRQTLANTWAVAAHHRSNGLSFHPELNLRNTETTRLPYALPVAAGCLVVLAKAMVQR